MASKTQATDRQYDERWTEIWQSGLSAGEVSQRSLIRYDTALVNLFCMRCQAWLSDMLVVLQRFDASKVSPSLVNLIQTRKLHVEDHHIFIPGCG